MCPPHVFPSPCGGGRYKKIYKAKIGPSAEEKGRRIPKKDGSFPQRYQLARKFFKMLSSGVQYFQYPCLKISLYLATLLPVWKKAPPGKERGKLLFLLLPHPLTRHVPHQLFLSGTTDCGTRRESSSCPFLYINSAAPSPDPPLHNKNRAAGSNNF